MADGYTSFAKWGIKMAAGGCRPYRAISIALLAVAATALSAGSPVLSAQSTHADRAENSDYAPHLSFEIASIRESQEGNVNYIDNPPLTSYYHAVREATWGLILNAYDIHLMQRIRNVPSWAMEVRYDITAKSDDATDQELAQLSESNFQAEKRHMLKELLADRFRLRIHTETEVATTYELVTTPRTEQMLKRVTGDGPGSIGTCNPHFSHKGVEVDGNGCPFRILRHTIEQAVGTDVVDRTGLTGNYAFRLMWVLPGTLHLDEDHFPEMQDAVREQLGLELRQTKATVTIWVVDHIERPTPN